MESSLKKREVKVKVSNASMPDKSQVVYPMPVEMTFGARQISSRKQASVRSSNKANSKDQ